MPKEPTRGHGPVLCCFWEAVRQGVYEGWAKTGQDSNGGLPPPAASRRRACRRATVIVLLAVVLSVTLTAVDLLRGRQPSGAALGTALVGLTFTAAISQVLANAPGLAWHLRGQREHLLAARTLTGWRTVGLTKLTRVRYFSVPDRGLGQARRHVQVRDTAGSWVGISSDDQAALRRVREAVLASGQRGIRVSESARAALQIERREWGRLRSCHNARPVLYTLAASVGLVIGYAVVVSLLTTAQGNP